jgi:hypothetical protein
VAPGPPGRISGSGQPENSDKKEQYYRNVKADEEVGNLAVESGGTSLNYMASKQLREALERKNALLKTSANPRESGTIFTKSAPGELDVLKKGPQQRGDSNAKREPPTASPHAQRG